MRALLAIAALGFAAAVLGDLIAGTIVRVQVRPHFGFVGCDMEIRVHVARSEEPRTLAIRVDGENYFRSWIDELEPNAAPTRRPSWIQKPPAGEYTIDAVLYDRRGKAIAHSSDVATILSSGSR